ncbi:hypothetical protein DXG01_000241 [Tephrocybe rancida]|nr:hypothetical protein DXG01_000241 [Tephrocybe rancida]
MSSFKDAELASEARQLLLPIFTLIWINNVIRPVTSLLNVMSMYHDTLLAKIVQNDRNYRPLIPASLHTRFTRAWSDKNTKYKWAARALQLIKFLELVVEMGLRRKVSSKAKWRAFLRISLLRITRKPLLSPPIPERDFDPVSISPSSIASSPTLAPSSASESPPATPDHLRNNHTPLLPHALLSPRSETTAEDYLLSKAMTTSSVKPSLSLVNTLSSPQDWLAESIYILRPLVYASLLASDRRSNRPLIVALMMELLSRNLRRNPPPSATLERTEYARRDRDMLWYLLRGSIWQSYTRPKVEALATRASHAPLFGLFGAFVQDWIPLIDEYYYSNLLSDIRRVVTGHDRQGISVVESDAHLISEPMGSVGGASICGSEDGATRTIDDVTNFGLVHPTGTNLRSTDLAPGAITPMHRTSSLDYNILGMALPGPMYQLTNYSSVQGELILITEDGTQKHLKNPGDTVVQKGTLHAWRNPSENWARWVTVLIAADPALVDGEPLAPAFLPTPLA